MDGSSFKDCMPPKDGVRRTRWTSFGVAAAFGAAVACLDAFTVTDGAASVLLVSLLVFPRSGWQWQGVVVMGLGCVLLTVASYFPGHGLVVDGDAIFRRLISIGAIVAAVVVVQRSLGSAVKLEEQGRFLELTSDAIFVRDDTGAITYWNRGAERLYGWTADEAEGQCANTLLRTKFSGPTLEIEARLAEQGRWQGELRQTTRDGNSIVVESRKASSPAKAGVAQSIVETNRDVTRRLAAEADLRHNEERYRSIFQSSGLAVWVEDLSTVLTMLNELEMAGVHDHERYFVDHPAFVRQAVRSVRVMDVNEAAVSMFEAQSKQELLGSLERVYHPGSTGSFKHLMLALAQGRQTVSTETSVRTLKGRSITVLMSVTFPADTAWMNEVLVTTLDVTDRLRAEAGLAQAKDDLEHVAQASMLGELTASIAHEVNQPLAGLLANAEAALRWLGRAEPNRTEAQSAITRLVQDGRRATEVVARVRAFSGQSGLSVAAIDVRQMVQEVGMLVRRELMQKHVQARFEVEPGLPLLQGDRIQLEQVLVNIALNGIQALGRVFDRPRQIKLRAARASEAEIVLEVEDNGPGIAPDDIKRLFTPFFTTRQDGMGLGLSICRSIVEAHQGRIRVASEAQSGATFSILLPIQSPATVLRR